MTAVIKQSVEMETAHLAQRFESARVEEILEWAVHHFGARLAMTSGFGAEGVILIDKISRIAPDIPIIYLDTGFHFPETEQLKEQLRQRYNLNIVVPQAALTPEQQAALHGEKLYESNPDLCCRLRKVEPLRQALKGYDAWIAALRRDQSPTRAGIRIVEWNARHEMVKINPLATWTRRQVWDYTLRHNLPYNKLYDEGYASIGCAPCTRPVSLNEHERTGRWVGHARLECGIHL